MLGSQDAYAGEVGYEDRDGVEMKLYDAAHDSTHTTTHIHPTWISSWSKFVGLFGAYRRCIRDFEAYSRSIWSRLEAYWRCIDQILRVVLVFDHMEPAPRSGRRGSRRESVHLIGGRPGKLSGQVRCLPNVLTFLAPFVAV